MGQLGHDMPQGSAQQLLRLRVRVGRPRYDGDRNRTRYALVLPAGEVMCAFKSLRGRNQLVNDDDLVALISKYPQASEGV